MNATPLTIAYTPEYLDWRLGAGHPTNPERARIAVEQVHTWADGYGVDVRTLVPTLDLGQVLTLASRIHEAGYLNQFHNGRTSEWEGCQTRLRDVAALMFTGTVDLVADMLSEWRAGVWFNPQGAKHHAHADHASGFCVLNDMAWAALRLNDAGKKVVYVDWDAHHGDGVEALLLGNPAAVTASIHDGTIFPGTGLKSRPAEAAYNWALGRGAGDGELAKAMSGVLALLDAEKPDVLLLACGADGLAGDPLSTLTYSLDGIGAAASALGAWAASRGVPVLIGGAGGYQPLTQTPRAWALTVRTIHQAFVPGVHATLAV